MLQHEMLIVVHFDFDATIALFYTPLNNKCYCKIYYWKLQKYLHVVVQFLKCGMSSILSFDSVD